MFDIFGIFAGSVEVSDGLASGVAEPGGIGRIVDIQGSRRASIWLARGVAGQCSALPPEIELCASEGAVIVA